MIGFSEDDQLYATISGNITQLEKKADGFIYLSSSIPKDEDEEGKKVVEFKLSEAQFVKILDDWKDIAYTLKPKELTIKYVNDQFIFETK